MKTVDTTLFVPFMIGQKKEKWLFQCDYCRYKAIFILWDKSGMSTGCERCLRGDMERIRKENESKD